MTTVVLIGLGAVGQYVVEALGDTDATLAAVVCRPGRERHTATVAPSGVQIVSRIDGLSVQNPCVVDCAGHAGLRAHGVDVLQRGWHLATVSVGALADSKLTAQLLSAAQRGKAQLRLLSGAIGALDALGAAREGGLESVLYQGRKPPQGWAGSPAEEKLELDQLEKATVHFSGNAREAATRYPKNANVAAAVALAGMGFERTRVELIADPDIQRNRHTVQARGAFGHLRFDIDGHALPNAPRSSALTAMSVVRYVQNQTASVVI